MLEDKAKQVIPELGSRGPSPRDRQAWREWPLFPDGRASQPRHWLVPMRVSWGKLASTHFQGVLAPIGCCNKLPQIWWFKTTEISSHTILEVRSLRSRCWQGFSSSGNSREESFLASSRFWWVQRTLACGCITPISLSIFQPSSLCLPLHLTVSVSDFPLSLFCRALIMASWSSRMISRSLT